MRSKKRPTGQLNFLAPTLKEQLNPKNELYLLANEIDWGYFEKEFAPMYSDKVSSEGLGHAPKRLSYS